MRPPTSSLASAATRRRALLPICLALLLVAPLAGPATGDHGGRPIGSLFACDRPVAPPRCTSVADNRQHFVYFDESLTEELAESFRQAMAEAYGGTRLTMIEQSSLNRLTDVVAFSQDYGDNGAAGWVFCPTDAPQGINPSGDRWCRHQELHLNLNQRYAAFFADDASRDHIACHELGHTVGLRHWGNPPQTSGPEVAATCMNANTPNGPVTLHELDIDHINAYSYRHALPLRHVPIDGLLPVISHRTPWVGGFEATELEHAATLAELTRSADAVVLGEVIALAPGRVFGDPSRAALHYASATVRVDELVGGSLPGEDARHVTLEIPLFAGPGTIEDLPVWGESVFFLRSKAESARGAGLSLEEQRAETGFYRLVTLNSLVVNERGRALSDADAPSLADLGGMPFGDALERVRAAGG